MSTILLKIEAIEARLASYSCPRGTAGRVHARRLQRHFQPASRSHSVAIGSNGGLERSGSMACIPTSDLGPDEGQQQLPQGGVEQRQPLRVHTESRAGFHNTSTTDDIEIIPHSGPKLTRSRHPQLPRHRIKAYHGDTFGLPFPDRRYQPHINSDNLRRALQSGDSHAILSALLRFIKVDDNGYQGHSTFFSLSNNTFSEVLRCLDPERFVGRYLNLHKSIGRSRPRYISLQTQNEDGLYQFSVNFMARIRVIIALRRSLGFVLSLPDYKHLLRCAAAVENPKASQAIWLAMQRDGVELDTECYNYYLSGLLGVGLSNGTQRSHLRVPPDIPPAGPEGPFKAFKGYYDNLGVHIKYEATKMFSDMHEGGLIGDERTFCLLMISLARVGDVQGVKGILRRVWDIDVDDLMTKNDSDSTLGQPKYFPFGSPFRPSRNLLFAVAHSFAINNGIPVALRLIDFVSRKYFLPIPNEVWEDLLGLTFALSTPRVTKTKADEMGLTLLPVETVTNLWAALISEPYNVTPNMAMYDRLIVNLLRRQRFHEAREHMEHARKLHIKNVYLYRTKKMIAELQSSLFEEGDDSERLEVVRGSTPYQNYQSLQRDKTFQHLLQNSSRQFLNRWCKMFIRMADKVMDIPSFTAVELPSFVYKFRLFLSPRIEYPIPTGFISFPSGSATLSKEHAFKLEARNWVPRNPTPTEGALLSSEALVESNYDADDNDDMSMDSQLDSEESFGKSWKLLTAGENKV
jgi:hypothetical protein